MKINWREVVMWLLIGYLIVTSIQQGHQLDADRVALRAYLGVP